MRVAVLSYWHVHARDYARQALAHPDVELVAVWDDDHARGRAGAEECGVGFEPDLDRLLHRPDLDGVIVTTATGDHHAVIGRAAGAGKHVFTEKLLAPTVQQAEDLVARCAAAGVVLTVSLPRLDAGSTRTIGQLLAGGRIGRPAYARVRLAHDGASAGWLPDRFFDPGAAIGGALTDLGCHPVYLIQLFLGAFPDTVSATYRRLTGHPVEDQAVVTLGYPGQAIGVAEASFVGRQPFRIEVAGPAGALAYQEGDGLRIWTDQEERVAIGPDGPGPLPRWVTAIRSGRRTEDNLERAVELTRLVAAANRAAASGQTMPYPGPGPAR